MKLIETRTIDTSKVRAMCIRNDYYTRGTNEEYSEMFEKCSQGQEVIVIAQDILEHSRTEELMKSYGCSYMELLQGVCFELINDCSITTVHIEE